MTDPSRACRWGGAIRTLLALGVALLAEAPVPAQVEWIDAPVLHSRSDAAMVYDAARRRVVLFGGAILRQTPFADTWERVGCVWTLRRPTTSPPPRVDHAMAYDAARGRVVLFGGSRLGDGAIQYADTWEWDGSEWVQRFPPKPPAGRSGPAMAYDASRQKTVMFGGRVLATGVDLQDTWEWDGDVWELRLPTSAPPPRAAHGMSYDAARQVTVLYGGLPVSSSSETWVWDGTDWTQHAVAGPGQRWEHQMAYDTARQVVVLFGGSGSGTWEWTGASWEHVPSPEHPPHDQGAAMTYDSDLGRMVLVTSTDEIRGTSTWERDGTNWYRSTAPCSASSPPVKAHAAASYDGARRRVVAFGGRTDSTWEWDGHRWHELRPPVLPEARFGHAMAYDAARGRTVMFGGNDHSGGSPGFVGTWQWDGVAWTRSWSPEPGPRNGLALAYDIARERVVMFGGTAGTIRLDETWEWDGDEWIRRWPSSSPSARFWHAMAYDAQRRRTVLFGGGSGTSPQRGSSDTWEWDGSDWSERSPVVRPGARVGHSMLYDLDRGRVVLFGGRRISNFFADTWDWDGNEWSLISVPRSPSARAFAALTYDEARRRTVLFGGNGTITDFGFADTWFLGALAPARSESLGGGCSAGAFAPTLRTNEPYFENPGFGLQLRTRSPSSLYAMLLGLASEPPVLFGACTLWTSAPILSFLGASDAGGIAESPQIAIPFVHELRGVRLRAQAAVLESAASPHGVALSPGLELVIGD